MAVAWFGDTELNTVRHFLNITHLNDCLETFFKRNRVKINLEGNFSSKKLM